jgi:hypothetical protein
MAVAMIDRPSWPYRPSQEHDSRERARSSQLDSSQADGSQPDRPQLDQGPAHEIIAEMARMLRDTRGSMLLGGGVLSAITVAIGLEAAFSGHVIRPGLAGTLNAGLLSGLLACWLTSVVLLAVANRPVHNALSEMRWRTGAPVDPRAGWLTLPPTDNDPEEWTWARAHLLLGGAQLARRRIQVADTWTYVTAAYFLIWTVIILLGL